MEKVKRFFCRVLVGYNLLSNLKFRIIKMSSGLNKFSGHKYFFVFSYDNSMIMIHYVSL